MSARDETPKMGESGDGGIRRHRPRHPVRWQTRKTREKWEENEGDGGPALAGIGFQFANVHFHLPS
jgi:hypothetical protein